MLVGYLRNKHDNWLGAPAAPAVRQTLRRPGLLRMALRGGFEIFSEWRCRVRGRAQLATLDPRMLRDIGITPVEAWHEANKLFWRE